jgi:mannose-6-phosphate isomerase-like protein (cupin superfamily)
MAEAFNVASLDWQPIRPDVAHGVYGKSLLKDGIKIILTRVSPGGNFERHQDKYGHLFFFLNGDGIVRVQEQEFKVAPGLIIRVNAGEPHSYANTGNQDLMLFSVNIPAG